METWDGAPGGGPSALETFALRAEILLGCTPVVYEFDPAQSATRRSTGIRTLPPHAARATLDILLRIILDENELDESQKRLEYLMGVDCPGAGDPQTHPYSDGWRLRVFERDGDWLYDFNGWFEDVESGAGVFYPVENLDNPIDVFLNSDEEFVAVSDEFVEVVEEYTTRRREALKSAMYAVMDDLP
jgi:hypothetical protein